MLRIRIGAMIRSSMNLTVKENSSKRLELHLGSSVFVYGFFGLLFLCGGFFVTHLLGVSTTLSIHDGALRYAENRLLFGDKERVYPVAAVSGASIILVEGFGRSYEVAIRAGDEVIQVALTTSDGDAKHALAEEVNGALSDPQGSFSYSESSMTLALILGALLIFCGLLSLYVLQTVNLSCDAEGGEINVRRKHWIFPITHKASAKLEDFQKADSSEFKVGSGTGGSAVSYKVFLEMKGGNTISVGFGPMFRERDADEAVREINRWFKRRKKSRR